VKLVQTPDGIANELFGDVVMVTEFIACFRDLLMPDDNNHISAGRYYHEFVINNGLCLTSYECEGF
jgi:hypothetical protein